MTQIPPLLYPQRIKSPSAPWLCHSYLYLLWEDDRFGYLTKFRRVEGCDPPRPCPPRRVGFESSPRLAAAPPPAAPTARRSGRRPRPSRRPRHPAHGTQIRWDSDMTCRESSKLFVCIFEVRRNGKFPTSIQCFDVFPKLLHF